MHRVSYFLLKEMAIDKQLTSAQSEIYLYSLEKIILQLLVISSLLLGALFLGSFILMFCYLTFQIVLRGQTSGYHTNSICGCIILTSSTSLISVYFALKYAQDFYFLYNTAAFLSSFCILKMSPINHKNLRLTKLEIKEMKKKTKRILFLGNILIGVLNFFPLTRPISCSASLAIVSVLVFMFLAKVCGQEVIADEGSSRKFEKKIDKKGYKSS